jgi:hypothetical protein
MPSFTEGKWPLEFLVSEASGTRSRDTETLISGQDLDAGTVLGKITASGKLTQFNQDGADGSENAMGILVNPCDASAADAECVIIARDAEVNGAELIWPGDITGPEQTTAEGQLKALGVLVR